MSDGWNIALLGATGAVGDALLDLLAERQFPVSKLSVLASARSAGNTIEFNGEKITIEDLANFDPTGVEIRVPKEAGASKRTEADWRVVGADAEETIRSMGYVGRVGMHPTDVEILNIMIGKTDVS